MANPSFITISIPTKLNTAWLNLARALQVNAKDTTCTRLRSGGLRLRITNPQGKVVMEITVPADQWSQ